MTTKSERRVNYEERVEQDGRLTGKHIRTLMHLQDLHSENELLKARIAELELHQAKFARCDLLEREVHKLRVCKDELFNFVITKLNEWKKCSSQL